MLFVHYDAVFEVPQWYRIASQLECLHW